MPSRITRSGTNFRGWFPSRKNSCLIPWHSLEERSGVLLLEFSPQVLRYHAQPGPFHLTTPCGATTYTPDYAADLRDGTTALIEIKLASEFRKPSVSYRLGLVRAALAERGHQLHLWDQRILGFSYRYNNLEELRPKVGRMSPADFQEAQMYIERIKPKTFGALARLAGDQRTAWVWIAAGLAGIDLDAPLTSSSEIYVEPPEARHAAIFA